MNNWVGKMLEVWVVCWVTPLWKRIHVDVKGASMEGRSLGGVMRYMRCGVCTLCGFVLLMDAMGTMMLSASSSSSVGARIGCLRGVNAAGGGGGIGRCVGLSMVGTLVGNCGGIGLSHGNWHKSGERAVNPGVLFCVTRLCV